MQPITHTIVFPLVMQNPSICRRFLKMILPEGDYPDLDELTEDNITAEKTFIRIECKDVRFDIYVQTEHRKIDMEMQNENRKEYHIPNRSKFYHYQMVRNQLEKGDSYEKLKPTTVIFLCMFDYFGMNHPRYTFKMSCEEYTGLNLGDGTCTIILNLKYEGEELTNEMNALYEYFRNGSLTKDNILISDIHKEVIRVNHDEEDSIMTWDEKMKIEAAALAEKLAVEIAEERAEILAEERAEELAEEKVAQIEKSHQNKEMDAIRKMKAKGISQEDIADITGRELEEIKEILG